jgi:hypothetical protein
MNNLKKSFFTAAIDQIKRKQAANSANNEIEYVSEHAL